MDLLKHLKSGTLEEIEADLEDTYERLTCWKPGGKETGDIADHLAAVCEELASRGGD